MARGIWRGALVGTLLAVATPGLSASGPRPELERLKSHVATLASPEYGGRRGEGARKAEAYLIKHLRGLGLEPLFDGQYTQDIPGFEPGEVLGRNVGARLLGSDPKLRDEWIIVSAHYDHLGQQGGLIFPGADDNASGVAMLLEVARAFARSADRPRRSLMFVGFDLEEAGLWGSRYFVRHPPVPLERVRLFLTADMIGRALGGVCDPYVFIMGSEHAPALRPWITEAAAGQAVRIGLLGTDMVGTRSDYGPFRAQGVPYLFFSTGENPCYHSPDDVPETLDYPKLEAISRVILGVVRQAARADALPDWEPVPDYPLSEAAAIRDVLQSLLAHRDELHIPPAQTLLMRNTLRSLNTILARGSITPVERRTLVRVAQLVLISVL